MQGIPSPHTFLTVLLRDTSRRDPLLFSVGVHLCITLIIFFPTSFFHLKRTPEIYSVELIDLSEPLSDPVMEQPSITPPLVQPQPLVEPAVSTKPVLSTRNIPQTPTEIKILRPRAVKKDLRRDKPVIDQTMVLAALQRVQNKEKAQQAQEELDRANEAVVEANADMLAALRQSILTRPSQGPASPSEASQSSSANTSMQSGASAVQLANSALIQYKATVNNHIAQHWRLPEGQKWDETLQATIIVKIKKDGIVTSSRFEQHSKSRQFDKFVSETIDKASPLPQIPEELGNKTYSLRLHFYPKGLQ